MRARYIGQAVLAGYYGITLIPGQVFDVPDHLNRKVSNTVALFEIVDEADAITSPADAGVADVPPKRGRGRPRKA